VRHHRRVVYLDDGEVALVRADGYETATLDGGADRQDPVDDHLDERSLRQRRI